MNLMTLKGLESIAEKEFEEQADKWVLAIAKRENVDPDELRPYVTHLYYHFYHNKDWFLEVVFTIPEHTPIKFVSNYTDSLDHRRVTLLENGKLVGDCRWYAYRTNRYGSPSFHGVSNLGEALLFARWANDGDEKAQWA